MNFAMFAGLLTICVLVATTVATEADAGHFIPKAFYTLDTDGHQSALHPVSPHIANYLRRLRRDVFSSSSSSSSSGGYGIPGHFQSSSTTQVVGPSVVNRFGGVVTPVHGTVTQTVGVVDKNGRLHYKTQQGHYKSPSQG